MFCMMHVCMHGTRNVEWCVMLINHALFPKYAQWSFEDKRQKGKHLSNPNLHFFSCRVIPSRSSFIPTSILRKNLFFFVFFFRHGTFFLSTAFYSRHVSFFSISIQHSKNIFFRLLFKIKQHLTSRKEIEWETIFCIFFQKLKTHFFDKSQILWILIKP